MHATNLFFFLSLLESRIRNVGGKGEERKLECGMREELVDKGMNLDTKINLNIELINNREVGLNKSLSSI